MRVELLTKMMDGVIGQVQFTGQARRGLALADAAQQQNHLGSSQLLVRKHRARQDRVDYLTATTAIAPDVTTAGLSEDSCLLHARATLRTT